MKPSFVIVMLLAIVPAMLLMGCGDNGMGPDTTAPLAPTLNGATATDNVAVVWWDANTEADLSGYFVYVTQNGSTRQINSAPIVANMASIGLDDGSARVFVTAVDFSGNESSASNPKIVDRSIATVRKDLADIK